MSQTLVSAVYEGRVRHRRFEPFRREFSQRIFMLYLDLGEIAEVMAIHPLWSTRRRAPARFRRADYLGPAQLPLRDAVADLVEARTGKRPEGPIRMLTHLRYWGVVENPVTFYYCFDRGGERLNTVVAEVTNVPWGDRHAYVVESRSNPGRVAAARLPKELHVSPLMSMDHEYDLRFAKPGRTVSVHMTSRRDGRVFFDATLNLSRAGLSRGILGRLLWRPPMSLKVLAGIYFQAALTWARGARYHPRPAVSGTEDRGLSGRAEAEMLCPVNHRSLSEPSGANTGPIA
jgi:hypothetical protein